MARLPPACNRDKKEVSSDTHQSPILCINDFNSSRSINPPFYNNQRVRFRARRAPPCGTHYRIRLLLLDEEVHRCGMIAARNQPVLILPVIDWGVVVEQHYIGELHYAALASTRYSIGLAQKSATLAR